MGPTQWRDFIIGLLDAGEVLIDDLHVVESPSADAVEVVANGDFENGANGWRIIGNHRHSEVIVDPDSPGNHVLHLVATGPTEHMHNHIETTLAGGASIRNGSEYEIRYRAKWLAGSNQVNTRLYFNRSARTVNIDKPVTGGTPGAANSVFEANAGPTFEGLIHSPPIPDVGEDVTVAVTIDDPDGVADAKLWRSVDGGILA